MRNFNKDNDAEAIIAAAQAISEKDLFAFEKAVAQLTLDVDFSQIISRDETQEHNAFSDLNLLEKFSQKYFDEKTYPDFYEKFTKIKLSRDYPKKISESQVELWREFYSLVENSILEPLAAELVTSHRLFFQLKDQLWLGGMLQFTENFMLENSQVKNTINALHNSILRFNDLLTVLSIGCDNVFVTFYKHDVPRRIADLTMANEILTLHIIKTFFIIELKLPEENILPLENFQQVLAILKENMHHERFNSTFLQLQVSRYIYIQNLLARINLISENVDKETFEGVFQPILGKTIALYRFTTVDELTNSAANKMEFVTNYLVNTIKISEVAKSSINNTTAEEILNFLRKISPSSSIFSSNNQISSRLLQKEHFVVIPDFSNVKVDLEKIKSNKQSIKRPESSFSPEVSTLSEKHLSRRPRSQHLSETFNAIETFTTQASSSETKHEKNPDERSSLLDPSSFSSFKSDKPSKLSALRKKLPFFKSTSDLPDKDKKKEKEKNKIKQYSTMGSINQKPEQEREEEKQGETTDFSKKS